MCTQCRFAKRILLQYLSSNLCKKSRTHPPIRAHTLQGKCASDLSNDGFLQVLNDAQKFKVATTGDPCTRKTSNIGSTRPQALTLKPPPDSNLHLLSLHFDVIVCISSRHHNSTRSPGSDCGDCLTVTAAVTSKKNKSKRGEEEKKERTRHRRAIHMSTFLSHVSHPEAPEPGSGAPGESLHQVLSKSAFRTPSYGQRMTPRSS